MTSPSVISELQAIAPASAISRSAFAVRSSQSVNCELVELRDSISELANSFDFDFDDVAGLHEDLRISDKSYASRRSSRDYITDFKRHHFRDVRNQVGNLENQIPRIRFLHRLSVQT